MLEGCLLFPWMVEFLWLGIFVRHPIYLLTSHRSQQGVALWIERILRVFLSSGPGSVLNRIKVIFKDHYTFLFCTTQQHVFFGVGFLVSVANYWCAHTI